MLCRLFTLLLLMIAILASITLAAPHPEPAVDPSHTPRSMNMKALVASLKEQKVEPKISTKVPDNAIITSTGTSSAWKPVGNSIASAPDYVLSPSFRVSNIPITREFHWTITLADAAPDGFARNVLSINGQTPGPLIEANEGDTIIVHVTNKLDEFTTIHWHGMNQNGTQYSDGVPAFTQCPIPAGGKFTYKFTPIGQWGTYWYHSHTAVQYTDGLYGPMVIHSVNEKFQKHRDYDEEVLLFFSDWYHDRGNTIANALLSSSGYNNSLGAPPSQSVLINGQGQYNCKNVAKSTDPSTYSCKTIPWPELNLAPNKRYRFRMINGGTHPQHHVTLDGHTFSIIASDGTDLVPSPQTYIPIHNGQRYDAIVTTDQGKLGSSFWLRVLEQTQCEAYLDTTATDYAQLVILYSHRDSFAPSVRSGSGHRQPKTTAATDPYVGTCIDLPDSALVPVTGNVPINTNAANVVSYTSNFGIMFSNNAAEGRFFVNGITATNHPYRPFLRTLQQGGQVSGGVAFNEFLDDVWVGDIIINNNDTFLDHPYHLHSRSFHIVARGKGIMTMEGWKRLNVNTVNAPLRDVLVIPSSSYAVLRIQTDTPGVWAFHCHIGWHLAGGFLGGLIIHPQALKERANTWPAPAIALCAASASIPDNTTAMP